MQSIEGRIEKKRPRKSGALAVWRLTRNGGVGHFGRFLADIDFRDLRGHGSHEDERDHHDPIAQTQGNRVKEGLQEGNINGEQNNQPPNSETAQIIHRFEKTPMEKIAIMFRPGGEGPQQFGHAQGDKSDGLGLVHCSGDIFAGPNSRQQVRLPS